jgi:hypothetical protein
MEPSGDTRREDTPDPLAEHEAGTGAVTLDAASLAAIIEGVTTKLKESGHTDRGKFLD